MRLNTSSLSETFMFHDHYKRKRCLCHKLGFISIHDAILLLCYEKSCFHALANYCYLCCIAYFVFQMEMYGAGVPTTMVSQVLEQTLNTVIDRSIYSVCVASLWHKLLQGPTIVLFCQSLGPFLDGAETGKNIFLIFLLW